MQLDAPRGSRSIVAVGTTIADRPPHRSVQARLRIRLLPWMSGGEARIRIGMQNAGLRNPAVQERVETTPSHLSPLTATHQNGPPQPANATSEDAQLCRVTRNGVVLVIAQHSLPKPCTDLAGTVMLPALKLNLHGFKLRNHPLLCRNAPDDECSVGELPAEVGETQECKGLWFSLSTLLPVPSGKAPEFRSVVSCPHVIPDQTLPAVPEILVGTARRPSGIESPPQDHLRIGQQLHRPSRLSCARLRPIDRTRSAGIR